MRNNLSAELVHRVRDLLDLGTLPPGQRINEVALAGSLGVSRTPLREALARLAAESAVDHLPRRGYWARPMSAAEVADIYPVRAVLDPAALREAGLPEPGRIAELRRIDRSLARATAAVARVDLDNQFHRTLLAGCENRLLLSLIDDLIRRTRRYELAYLGQLEGHHAATNEHAEICAALERSDLEAACAALARNMQSALEPLLGWLAAGEGS